MMVVVKLLTSNGGHAVPGRALALNSAGDLVVRSAADELRIDARGVFLEPRRGAGLEPVGFCPELKERLPRLVAAGPAHEPAIPAGSIDSPVCWAMRR